jgi:CRISPR-associated endonuclease/helicase Cas3
VWRRVLPVIEGRGLVGPRELEAFLEAAGPHVAERLETEVHRVVDWLDQRFRRATAEHDTEAEGELEAPPTEQAASSEETPAEEPAEPARKPLTRDDIIGVLIAPHGRNRARAITGADLANKSTRDALARELRDATMILDTRVGGLRSGLLNVEADDADEVSAEIVGFRVERTRDESSSDGDWREELRIPIGWNEGEDEPNEWLTVTTRKDLPAESEEGRSVSPKHAQLLDEHHAWTDQAARTLATRLQLPSEYVELLALAARLHDEGKRAPNWQRAFRAEAGVYAKTTSRPLFSILGHYRHELGSLPRAEKDPAVIALDDEQRDLCLHLIAAHHGNARPLLRTDGAEEPPTRLAARAQEIALRFARLEKRWGPWGLAWWEALLRAADQQASRRNDDRTGGRDG